MIFNITPPAEIEDASSVRPISLTVRDQETYINLAELDVSIGYAQVHSKGNKLFDLLPNTRRLSLLGKADSDGLIDVVDSGLLIAKNSVSPQKTVYATTVDTPDGYKSVMVTAVVRRDVTGSLDSATYPGIDFPPAFTPSPGYLLSEEDEPFTGTVLGLEYGPRGRALYLWLQQKSDNTRTVRLTSYIREDNLPSVDEEFVLDWRTAHRFTILWNEASGYVDVFVSAGTSSRIFHLPITEFPVMPENYSRLSGTGDVVAVYGQEGTGDGRSVWSNIAVTTDVAHPIHSSVRMSNFSTQIQGPEFWKIKGSDDPRSLPIGAWFDSPSSLFADPDPSSSSRVSITHFRMTKPTPGKTFTLYRREPGLASSDTDGFVIQARIEALGITRENACTGVGITVFDGQTIFQLILFEDDAGVRRLGLLRDGGQDADGNDYYIVGFDWGEAGFRFVVDPREGFISIFNANNLGIPLLAVEFDRGSLPAAADKGWQGEVPFIAIGHTVPTQTSGVFALHEMVCNHLYRGWAASDHAPEAANPIFSITTSGSPSLSTSDGLTTITCGAGESARYSQPGYFSPLRGATVEARVKIPNFRPRFRSGTYLLMDDGTRSFALTFVDSYSGKYAAIALRDGLGGFREVVGRDGEGALYSFPCDWTEFHMYRLERQVYRGVQIYLDDEVEPRISFPESKLDQLPNSQYPGTPTIAFGQFTTEGSTSQWAYLNSFFSRGYEISTKKNKNDLLLRNELYNTQAIVVVSASDE